MKPESSDAIIRSTCENSSLIQARVAYLDYGISKYAAFMNAKTANGDAPFAVDIDARFLDVES